MLQGIDQHCSISDANPSDQSLPTASAMSLIILPAIVFSFLLILPRSDALVSLIEYQTPSSCSAQLMRKSLTCQLEEAKLRIDRLESILEERIGDLNGKNQYIQDRDKKIEELALQIDNLKTALSASGNEHSRETEKINVLEEEIDNLKTALSASGNEHSRETEKINVLEEEVRLLWADSRRNNFEIHTLELNALDAERKLQEVTSQVGELKEIVTEQWIQIQQLEQAALMAEMRTSRFKKELLRKCPFLKFFIDIFDGYGKMLNGILDPSSPRDGSVLTFCKSKVLQIFSATKHYHYQLQGLVKHAMKSNEFTETFAHEEVVFFVASAIVTFPFMAAVFLLTQRI